MIIFLNAQKSFFSNPQATFNGTTLTGRSKAAPSKVNIGSARAVFLKKYFLNCSQLFFKQMAVAHSIFTLDGGVSIVLGSF